MPRLVSVGGYGFCLDRLGLTLALFSGQLIVGEVADRGLQISGDVSVLHRVLSQLIDPRSALV